MQGDATPLSWIAALNQQWNIWPTPNGTIGVQQSLEGRLRLRIQQLHKVTSPQCKFRQDLEVHVKLSGDGTNIGKRLHVLNFSFTLLEEGSLAYSAEGNHPLAIIKHKENYEGLQDSLADIGNEVEQLQDITVDGQKYHIIYYLGGDWKFLAICTGIDSATSTYACIWCKCAKQDRHDTSKVWSITDPTRGARTVEENLELSKKTRSKFNVSHAPLFPNIPLMNVVIDNLHLFLRISDVLLTRLIESLQFADAIAKAKKFSGCFDVENYKHLKAYEDFVASLGIPSYHFYVGKSSKLLKVRSLTGTEKLKLFQNIRVANLLPNISTEEHERIQHLWDELLCLNAIFSKRPGDVTEEDIDNFETRSKDWVDKFLELYHEYEVTPYIHAMYCHVGQFMRIHGSYLAVHTTRARKVQ